MTDQKALNKTKQELAKWDASNERHPVRLSDLGSLARKDIVSRFGLPANANPAFIVALGGKPYMEHSCLWDLTHQDYVVVRAGHVEPPIFKPCSEMGCVSREHKGWRTDDGTIYDSYPNGKKAYKNYVEHQPKDNERMAIVHYQVEIKNRKNGEISVYGAYGDACPHNCTSVTRDSLLRMAETRAINRCLRPAVGYAGTTYEERIVELPGNGGEGDTPPFKDTPKAKPTGKAPEAKANGKRLRDFPGALEQLQKRIEDEAVVEGDITRKVKMPLFLEYLQSENLLEPDEKGELDLGNMLFADSTALTKDWDKKIGDYWRWVDKTYPDQKQEG